METDPKSITKCIPLIMMGGIQMTAFIMAGRPKTMTYRKFFSEVNVQGKIRMKCTLQKSCKHNAESDDDEESKEVILDCEWTTETDHNTNLKRHVKEIHPTVFERIEAEAAEPFQKQKPLSSFGFTSTKPGKIEVQLTMNDILISILKSVAVDGRPLDIINDSGFRHLVDPILKALPGKPEKIYARKIRTLIHDVAKKLRKEMAEIFKKNGNKLSLCLDGASYQGRKFLGIKVQCRESSDIAEFHSFSLGTVELFEASTGRYLKKIVSEELKLFGVASTDIVSATTDGGAHYWKIAYWIDEGKCKKLKKIKTSTTAAEKELEVDDSAKDGSYDSEDNSDWEVDEIYVVMNEEEEEDIGLHFEIEKLQQLSCEEFKDIIPVIGVRCVVHLLQLAIEDFLKEINASARVILEQARDLVKKCRTPNLRSALSQERCSYLSIDVTTRWNATYDMLDRVLKNRRPIVKCSHLMKNVKLDPTFWCQLETLVNILRPCYQLTVELSRESILPSDAYKLWMRTRLELHNMDTNLAKTLSNCMLFQQHEVFDTSFFSAVLFLDPRFSRSLTRKRKDDALKSIFQMYEHLKNAVLVEDQPMSLSVPLPVKSSLMAFIAEEVEEDGDGFISLSEHHESKSMTIKTEIDEYLKEAPIDEDADILLYWQKRKHTYPLLYKVATLFFQIAVSEVNVERLFSNLKFILHYLRNSLGDLMLKDLLLIRSNFGLITEDVGKFF